MTANQQIPFNTLRVMDEQGQALGIMDRQEAINRALSQKKDLILVTDKANPPVAKIIQLSKYKFQLSQKKAEQRKKSRVQDIKEIRLRPFIDENDLQAKIRKATGFIKKNHKVRLAMELRGRALTKQDLANQILDRFVSELADVAQVETERKLIGKRIQMQLMPSKKSKKENKENS
ncbi:translation initiation factor IF-3 [bacterium]|nr:translation initiation factor IF-3 [bacterium]